jgi:hypothetical protein
MQHWHNVVRNLLCLNVVNAGSMTDGGQRTVGDIDGLGTLIKQIEDKHILLTLRRSARDIAIKLHISLRRIVLRRLPVRLADDNRIPSFRKCLPTSGNWFVLLWVELPHLSYPVNAVDNASEIRKFVGLKHPATILGDGLHVRPCL